MIKWGVEEEVLREGSRRRGIEAESYKAAEAGNEKQGEEGEVLERRGGKRQLIRVNSIQSWRARIKMSYG